MSYSVTSTQIREISLNEQDLVKSVLQNISIILRTRLGTVPLYRQFGTSFAYLDRPIVAATPMLFAHIKEVIEQYEPRAEIVNVSFEADPSNPGKLTPTVEVNIIDG